MSEHAHRDQEPGLGAVYSAVGEGYLLQACTSALSLKEQAPSMKVTVFTNVEEAEHMRGFFDSVVALPPISEHAPWAARKFLRFYAFEALPYETSIFIDCDTRVLSPRIRSAPEVLARGEIGMVEALPETSLSRRAVGRRMFNAGVIVTRRTPKVLRLFTAWKEACWAFHGGRDSQYLQVADALTSVEPSKRRKLLAYDQIPLSYILSPSVDLLGLDAVALPPEWNQREYDVDAGDTIIHHHLKYRAVSREDLDHLLASDRGREHSRSIAALARRVAPMT